jgi:hypothetical protein
MRQKSVSTAGTPEKLARDIRRASRKQYSAEEKVRIVLDGLRGETPIAELYWREGITVSSSRLASAGSLGTAHARRRPMKSSGSGARRRT